MDLCGRTLSVTQHLFETGKRGVPSRETWGKELCFLKELSLAHAVNSKVGKLFCVLQCS